MARLFLRGAPFRLVLVILAVALSSTAVCAVDVLNRAVLRAFVEVVDGMAGRASLQVSAGDVGLFTEGLVHQVGRVAGVAEAIAVMSTTAFPVGAKEPVTVYGIPFSRQSLSAYALDPSKPSLKEALAMESEARAVYLPRQFAARRGLGAGDRLDLDTPAGRRSFTVRGVLDLDGMSRLVGSELLVMNLPGAQLDFGRLRFVNRADVVLEPSADIERVRAAIAAKLPPGVSVTTPIQRRMDLQRVMRSFEILLWAIAVVALGLSILVAFDTLATHFEALGWQAGTLRALGLRRGQVWRELLKQGSLLGVAGVLLGVPAGIALGSSLVPAVAVSAAVNYKITAPAAAPVFSLWSAVLAGVAGLAASLGAALLPAWRAARLSITATVGQRGREAPGRGEGLPWVLRVAVLGGCVFTAWAARRSTSASLAATALVLLAVALAARPLVTLIVPRLMHLLDRFTGSAGQFACANIMQGTRRTSLTLAVIGVGIGSVLWIRCVVGSFEFSLAEALAGSLRSDLIVASDRVASGWVPAPVRVEALAAVARVPGVSAAVANRIADWTHEQRPIAINAFDSAYFSSAAFDKPPLVGPHAPDAWQSVGRGEAVVVSTNFLLNFGRKVGDRIALDTPSGTLTLPIAGATLAFVSAGGSVEISRELYERHWHDANLNRIWVMAASPSSLPDVREAISERVGAAYGLRALSSFEMRDHLIGEVRRAFAPMVIVEGVLFLVVILALSDTLTASVLRRVREIGTSRAVGVRRSRVVRIVFAEALVVGGLGLALAAVAGAVLGALWVYQVLPHLLGWLLLFDLPFATALLVASCTIATSVAAAALPSWQAARLEPAAALRYE